MPGAPGSAVAVENASLTPLPGHLYVVATPIGNLADLTDRARAILGAVDLVACEDTRTTGAMLTRLGIRRELISYHEHNELEAAERLAEAVAAGRSVALVSDAGTPTLSDPGFRLVRACRRRGLPVDPGPGTQRAGGRAQRKRSADQLFSVCGVSAAEVGRADRLPGEAP